MFGALDIPKGRQNALSEDHVIHFLESRLEHRVFCRTEGQEHGNYRQHSIMFALPSIQAILAMLTHLNHDFIFCENSLLHITVSCEKDASWELHVIE